MPKFNKKFKRRADDTMDTLYDLEKMSEREVVWPSPKTPEVSSVVQFIIDNSVPTRNFTSGNHPNVLLPSGFVKDEEVLSRDSNSEGDYTVLGVSPSITPSLACEVLIAESSQNNEKKQMAPVIESSTKQQQQHCLREIDLSTNHNHNGNPDDQLDKDQIEYEDDLSESELNVDETEAMKELGYCIHRISTDFKLFSEKQDVNVKCCACNEYIGRISRECLNVIKLEFSCNYCEMIFELIGDLNMHLINHYHEIETGRSVIYDT